MYCIVYARLGLLGWGVIAEILTTLKNAYSHSLDLREKIRTKTKKKYTPIPPKKWKENNYFINDVCLNTKRFFYLLLELTN